jgi:ceramide glucosyltransferase
LLFTHGLPWAVLAAAVAPTAAISAAYLIAYLILRFSMAWTVGVWCIGDQLLRRRIWLVPLRDLVNFAIYIFSFASSRVTWGGIEYEMKNDQMREIRRGN